MVAKFSKTFLIGVIGGLLFIIGVGIIYIVLDNMDAKMRYSVKVFTPQGEVPQWVDFSITFSDAVIDNSLIGTEVPAQAIQFTPAVQGKARWVARDRIVFFLESPLVPSAQYTVELSPDLNPSDTYVLTGQRKFTFATQPFAVTQTNIEFQYGENRDNANAVGTITFNYPVTIADLKAHLSIQLNNEKEIPYFIQTRTTTTTTVALETARIRRHDQDQEIKIRIEKGFKCMGGQIGLKTASVTPIVLRGRGTLGVTYATVREEGGKPYISLRFSAPVRSQTIAPYLELKPKVAYQLTHRYGNVLIHGDFKRRTTYTVKIRRGVTAQNDSALKGDYTTRLIIPDVPPQLRFVGGGFFLARTGELNLGLATINVKRVDLYIEKVFANNLIYVSKLKNWGRWAQNLGKPVHAAVFDVASQLNEEVTTPISLAQYLTDEHVGVFKVVARDTENRWIHAHQWVAITDLGVIAKRVGDTLSVWVKSLANGGHVSAAHVKLISDNNQTLVSGTTNRVGFVKFTGVAEKTEGFTPFMLTFAKGDDLAFLQLNRHHIATADFNVAGPAYLEKGYEAFLYTSRGVYRPGETVQLAGIVRGPNQGTPPPLPVRIELLAPDGRIMRELRQQTTKSGACDVQIPIPAYAQTGGYIAKMRIADKVVGRVQFQVEEFMPDRMKISVTSNKIAYSPGEEIDIEVVATNLFGPPAAEQKVSVSCELETASFFEVASLKTVPTSAASESNQKSQTEKWRSFHFSDAGSSFEKQRTALGDAKTDDEGKASYKFTIPATLKAPSLLKGVITATVSEVGGRAVTATHSVVIHPYTHYVGLRRATIGTVSPKQQLRFDYIALDSDWGVAAGRALQLTFHKVHWNTILRQNAEGRYRYISEPQTVQMEARALTSAADVGTFLFSPSAYGEYRVRLEDVASGAKAEIGFHVGGWGTHPVSMAHPTRLDLELDKPAYRPGETARLHIKAPFPGKLLLTVEREKILSYRTIALKGNTATLNIPVQYNYQPNVYLSATLIREVPMAAVQSPGDDASGSTRLETASTPSAPLPSRAFGVVPLKIDAEPSRLAVEMFLSRTDAAGVTEEILLGANNSEQVLPNSEVNIAFRVKGRRAWQKYEVCIAAVDEGILGLTDFQTPNPHNYFYRQRGLQTRSYDLYSGILPEIASITDNSSTGGDTVGAMGAKRLGRLSTRSIMRVTPVSLWSGFVKTDSRGRGTVHFNIPQFNGRLRLMAVAFAGTAYGAADAYLTVREPIVLTPTFPRFLTGGDRVRLPVTVFNGTGADGTFTVELQAAGDVQLVASSELTTTPPDPTLEESPSMEKQVHVPAGVEHQVFFDMRVHDAIGAVVLHLSAYGNDTEATHRPVHLPLRSAAPPVTKTGQGVVRADNPVDFIFPANLIADSSEFTLTLSPFPTLAFAESLRYLVRYPHGCLEQTTSQVFPLLYFSDLARSVEPMLAEEDAVDYYITAGITKLESMLMSNHHFAYWPGGTYVNPWSSIYASHFLVEARKAGYEVSDRVYNAMLEGLREQAKRSRNLDTPTDDGKMTADVSLATYACYVLAAAGHPEKGMMHYLKNRRLEGLGHYSHFQLAGAFALSGELETALSMLPVSVSPNNTGKRETGGTLNSPVRAQAIILDVLAEVNENHPSVPMLVTNLNEAASEGNRWATTQENAFAFLALGKILKKHSDKDYTGTLMLNGEHFADFDATDMRYTDEAWDGAQVRLTVQGEGSCYYYWTVFGIQRDSFIEEYERELQVRRRYFNQDGEERTRTFSHGDLIVAEITVKALTANLENVVVVDMLPTGFEIENPRLESRAGIPWLKKQGFKPDYIDIRDDRLIFFGTFPRQRERKFYYALRAVTQGEFTLPPIAAEAMYDATKSAVAGSMRIKVVDE